MPADSVHDRIVANVIATLAGIAAGATYYTNIVRVYEMVGNAVSKVELPCALVLHRDIEEKYTGQDVIGCDLKLAVMLSMTKTDTWQKSIRHFAEDAKRALRADHTRGGNAFDTYVERTAVANENDGFAVALAQVDVRIHFRHLLDDPTAAT